MSRERLQELSRKLGEFSRLVSIEAKGAELAKVEARMADGDFWTDQAQAKQTMARVKSLKAVYEPHQRLATSVRDGLELLELAESEGDAKTIADIAADAARLEADYSSLEPKLAL